MPKTLAIRKWASGKNALVVLVAQQIAVGAEACYETCLRAREKVNLDGSTEIPLKDWRKLYAHPARASRVAYGDILEVDGRDIALDFYDAYREWQGTSRREMREALASMKPAATLRAEKQAVRAWKQLWKCHYETLEEGPTETGAVPADTWERLHRPEVLFFFRVMFPCWMFYGESLQSVVAKARRGYDEAIEKILRLDSGAMSVPAIAWHVNVGMQDPSRRKRFTDAMRGRPLRKVTRQKVKVSLAACILKLSLEIEKTLEGARKTLKRKGHTFQYAKAQLDSPNIRALFDSVAKDFRGELQDNDLPLGDHAFYMAMKRELGFWSGYL